MQENKNTTTPQDPTSPYATNLAKVRITSGGDYFTTH